MALNPLFFTTSLLLFSFLLLASASDYSYNTKSSNVDNSKTEDKPELGDDGYSPKPYVEKSSKSEDYKSKQEDNGYNGSKPEDYDDYANKTKSDDRSKQGDDGYASKPKSEDNGYNKKPGSNKPKSDDKPKPEDDSYDAQPNADKPKNGDHDYDTKPGSEKPKSEDTPKHEDDGYAAKPDAYTPKPKEERPLPIRLEGLVLCKSSSKYYPIPGAVAKITCRVADEHGHETAPCSLYSTATDANGYFVAELSNYILTNGLKKITECRAYLDNSPLESCKIPTDVNKGISGALLSSYRILEEEKIKLYWVGPFFFTSEDKSNPDGY